MATVKRGDRFIDALGVAGPKGATWVISDVERDFVLGRGLGDSSLQDAWYRRQVQEATSGEVFPPPGFRFVPRPIRVVSTSGYDAMLVGARRDRHLPRFVSQAARAGVRIEWVVESGRSVPPDLPDGVQVVLTLEDFIGFEQSNAIRRMCRSAGIPLVRLPFDGFGSRLAEQVRRLEELGRIRIRVRRVEVELPYPGEPESYGGGRETEPVAPAEIWVWDDRSGTGYWERLQLPKMTNRPERKSEEADTSSPSSGLGMLGGLLVAAGIGIAWVGSRSV